MESAERKNGCKNAGQDADLLEPVCGRFILTAFNLFKIRDRPQAGSYESGSNTQFPGECKLHGFRPARNFLHLTASQFLQAV